MLPVLVFVLSLTGIYCEPETVRENFDYFSYGSNDDLLKNLDLHLVSEVHVYTHTHILYSSQEVNFTEYVICACEIEEEPTKLHSEREKNNSVKSFQPKDEIVLRPQEVKDWPQTALNVGQITSVSINSLGQPVIFHRAERVWDERRVTIPTKYHTLFYSIYASITI